MRNFVLGLVDDCASNTDLVVCLCLLTESPATGLVALEGTFNSVNSQQVKKCRHSVVISHDV